MAATTHLMTVEELRKLPEDDGSGREAGKKTAKNWPLWPELRVPATRFRILPSQFL
jgi:hypothetical protein